jgi:hypothetical protein
VLYPRDPDLLAIDDIAVTLTQRGGLDAGGVGAGGGLGHAHRLQAQLAGRDLGQPALLLLGRAMAQQRAHVVHLAMTGARIAAAAVDLFHDHRGLDQAQPRAAVFLRNERGHPAGTRQGIDEGFRVGAGGINLAEVFVGILGAQGAYRVADIEMVGGSRHGRITQANGIEQGSNSGARCHCRVEWCADQSATMTARRSPHADYCTQIKGLSPPGRSRRPAPGAAADCRSRRAMNRVRPAPPAE